jgi:hypothetical protein
MGLMTTIQNATGAAFKAIGDLKVTGNAVYQSVKVFDPNKQKNNYVEKSDTCELVQYDFEASEKLTAGVLDNDYKFLIQRAELTQPIENYKTITIGSEVWDIEGIILKESSQSIVVYHMRLSNA